MSVIIQKTANTVVQCANQLVNIINNDPLITTICESISIDDGVFLSITCSVGFSASENTALNVIVDNWDNSMCELFTDINGDDSGSGLVIKDNDVLAVGDVNTINLKGSIVTESNDSGSIDVLFGYHKIENVDTILLNVLTPITATGVNAQSGAITVIKTVSSTQLPSIGLTSSNVAIGGSGTAIFSGRIDNVDTTLYSSGDNLWVDTSGGITNVKPTGTTNKIQKIAIVLTSNINGSIIVLGNGETNNLPNISNKYAWVGDSNDVPQPTEIYTKSDVDNIITLSTGPSGSIMNLIFNNEKKSKNTWLSHEGDSGMTSNNTPAILPWDCILSAITFTNKHDNVDTDIQIYRSTITSGSSASLVHQEDIRNSRVSSITNFPQPVLFNAGDKIGVYLKDSGHDPDRVVITLYFLISNSINTDYTETYKGEF